MIDKKLVYGVLVAVIAHAVIELLFDKEATK